MGGQLADLLVQRHDLLLVGGFQGFGLWISKDVRKAFQDLLFPFQELRIVDLVLGRQLGHRFLFLQNFEDNLDLQFDGIALPKRAHNVLKTPLIFCLNFPIHYNSPNSSTIHAYCTLINMEVEAIKKDLEKILELIKGRGENT